MNRNFLILGLLLLIGGCSHYSLVKADTHKIGNAYVVRTPVEWNKYNRTWLEIWTRDGTGINQLTLYEGISEGRALYPLWKRADAPKFRADMGANDVMEFVVASFAQQGFHAVEGHNLRPADFGALPGFRFELSYMTQSGLEMKGALIGAVAQGKLRLVLFNAPKLYFFDRDKDLVEQIMGSIETT